MFKKIDISSIKKDDKKSFTIQKKKQFTGNKEYKKTNQNLSPNLNVDNKKKPLPRKFIEQQATKAFIKKDDKPAGKSKLKLKIELL